MPPHPTPQRTITITITKPHRFPNPQNPSEKEANSTPARSLDTHARPHQKPRRRFFGPSIRRLRPISPSFPTSRRLGEHS